MMCSCNQLLAALLVGAAAARGPWGLPDGEGRGALGVRGGAGWFGGSKDKAAAKGASASATMSEAQISEILAVVPVFCLADETGRPVLMQEPPREDKAKEGLPRQVFFTDVDVARAHAARIGELAGDESLKLKLAALDLHQVFALDATDRDVSVMADPRELHVARQLVLKGAGYVDVNATLPAGADAAKVVDFADETSVAAAARTLAGAADLDGGIPLFSLKELNATVRGNANVQPWFLSFADLVRAYVNSTAVGSGDDADEAAARGLEHLLNNGGITVATLDSVLAAVRDPAGDARQAFILPPASSLAVLRQQQEQANAPPPEPAKPPSEADQLAAAAASIDGGGDSLFDQ